MTRTDTDTLFWVLSIPDTIMADTDTDTRYFYLFISYNFIDCITVSEKFIHP